MSPLKSRKSLLLAESELNRVQALDDLTRLTGSARALYGRACSLSSVASPVAALISGLVAFQRPKAEDHGKPSAWLPRLIKGVGVVSTLWLAIRSRRRDRS
jgi:hypothetical protein